MLPAAALLTGFGGLVLQLAWMRRYGLLLGNTSGAAALVLGVFLAALGAGGLAAARVRRLHVRPVRAAAAAYAGVALAGLLAEPGLRPWIALPAAAAPLALLLVPGVPAALMGLAFPLLFAGLPRGASVGGAGRLHGANLLGAVVGAWCGGNLLVPELGLLRSGQVAALAYLAAAALLWFRSGSATPLGVPAALPPAPRTSPAERRAVFAAGMLLLGMEVLWLRRLPFFLEGFQPTLSGVVAAVLAWNALGAAVLAPLLGRAFGARALPAVVAAAVVACNAGLHEHLAPGLARWPVESTAGMHARVLLGASAAVALPCLFLGAIAPLALARYVHPETRGAAAGAVFGLLGLGELSGALLGGHVLPRVLPEAYFAAAPLALSLGALFVWRRAGGTPACAALAVAVVAGAAFGVGGAGTPLSPHRPAQGARHDRREYVHLAHAVDATLTASVAYNRRTHSMVLFTDEFRATETGPNTAYMRALGHLPFLLRGDLARTAVIALGTGATVEAVLAWPEPRRVDVVEVSRAVVALAPRFVADGPVPTGAPPAFAADPRAVLHVTDGRAFLARLAPGSLDLIAMEPLLPYAPGTPALYSAEFYELARRALGERGLLVQWLPTHALPRAMFDALLATFVQAFPYCSVWLVDHSTLLVGSAAAHAPNAVDLRARFAALPEALRGELHDVGLCGPEDVLAALVCAAPHAAAGGAGARVLTDDAPFLEHLPFWSGIERLSFLPDNLLRLAELVALDAPGRPWRDVRLRRLSALSHLARARLPDRGAAALAPAVIDLDAARVGAPHSVLLHREQNRALRELREHAILETAQPARARDNAERVLQRDPGSAIAYAALAASSDDEAARARLAAEAAALDPLLWQHLPPAFARADLPAEAISPREDLGALPDGEALARAATGTGPRPAALRGTFPARVGRALLACARARPLSAEERGALLPLLDPWLWQELGEGVRARRGDVAAEVLPLWRRDLPVTDAVSALLAEPTAQRRALAEHLSGRREPAACALLARLLVDGDVEVRRAAGASLTAVAGDRIPYDPDASEAERARAADALRRLHNPPP